MEESAVGVSVAVVPAEAFVEIALVSADCIVGSSDLLDYYCFRFPVAEDIVL